MTKQFCNGCNKEMSNQEADKSDFVLLLRGVKFVIKRVGCSMEGVDVHLCLRCIVKEIAETLPNK